MTRLAFLGLGAMGSRMATNLIKAGHAITVWNRDVSKAEALAAAGAKMAGTPKAAAIGADIVIAMVRDDEASDRIWLDAETGALSGMAQGAIAVESSTLTISHVKTLATAASQRGIRFLDAPVAGSRPQAEAGQLIFMVGGDEATLAAVEPVLKAMGGAVHHAGTNGSGAAIKLAVNALFGIQVAALAEQIGILQKSGIDAARAIEIIGATPVASAAAKVAAAGMLGGQFNPMFPVELVEKDFGYVEASASTIQSKAPLAKATRSVMASAIAAGFGKDNLTGIVRLYQ
jgi:3-hydroxyisobutyrate dehydrogenase